MKKFLKNSEMAVMIHQLKPILSRRDKVGYVAARNYRVLSDSLTEYNMFKNNLIKKYGECDKDENGNELSTISISVSSPQFHEFCTELEPLNNIEHEVELMTAGYEEVIVMLYKKS